MDRRDKDERCSLALLAVKQERLCHREHVKPINSSYGVIITKKKSIFTV